MIRCRYCSLEAEVGMMKFRDAVAFDDADAEGYIPMCSGHQREAMEAVQWEMGFRKMLAAKFNESARRRVLHPKYLVED